MDTQFELIDHNCVITQASFTFLYTSTDAKSPTGGENVNPWNFYTWGISSTRLAPLQETYDLSATIFSLVKDSIAQSNPQKVQIRINLQVSKESFVV